MSYTDNMEFKPYSSLNKNLQKEVVSLTKDIVRVMKINQRLTDELKHEKEKSKKEIAELKELVRILK